MGTRNSQDEPSLRFYAARINLDSQLSEEKLAKNQSSYFSGKHLWSKTKDDLLSCYLTPFFQKVFRYSENGIIYIDAFAGTGKFEDGELGSPLIALSKLQAVASRQKAKRPVQFIFAEANNESRAALEASFRNALGESRYIRNPLVYRSCEEAIAAAQDIRLNNYRKPSTLFYYIDPFGVKNLDMKLLLQSPNPQHTEVLVNFNSLGFVRAACAARKTQCNLPSDLEVFDEGPSEDTPPSEQIEMLTRCLGTDKWIGTINRFESKSIDFWQAEYEIANLFCRSAEAVYRYVTNMPIKDVSQRSMSGGLVKYRMIHMTNNADGCILMNDNMLRRNELNQTQQLGLFKVDVDGMAVEEGEINRQLRIAVQKLEIGKEIKMGHIAAAVISACGVFDSCTNLLKTYVGPLLDDGTLERAEKYTPTGKCKRSFNCNDLVFRAR